MPMGRIGGARIARGTAAVAGRRRLGLRPLLLGGLALCAAAVALALVRRGRRGGPGPGNASAPPPAVSGPAPPETPEPPEGASSGPSAAETSGPWEGTEARVRALIAEDTRTRDLPPVSIEVDAGMAWVDGSVPSPEAKETLTDVVAGAEGVNIVVNRAVIRRS